MKNDNLFYILYVLFSDIPHQDIPYRHNVTDTTCKDEEMEHGVHEPSLVDAIEHCSCDVAHALSDNPGDSPRTGTVYQRLKRYQHTQSHAHKADCLQVAVRLEVDKTHHRAGYGTSPNENEQAPSPIVLLPQGYERDGRIRARDVPIDGGMIPPAQPLFPFAPSREGMINGGSQVRAEHSKEIEDDTCRGPSILMVATEYQKGNAHGHTQHNAAEM